jgi:predicted NAD/FAD-dependent oxidoreductase
MANDLDNWDTIVIGAGISGLAAAGILEAAGQRVCVLDKGRGVGGRATRRRTASAVFDHGAQFIRAHSPAEAAALRDWEDMTVVRQWTSSLEHPTRGTVKGPIYVGRGGMNCLAKYLAAGLTVAPGVEVVEIRPATGGWVVGDTNRRQFTASSVVLTSPVPQSLNILEDIRAFFAPELLSRLENVRYEPCFAVLAEFGERTTLPEPGAIWPGHGPVAWIADNWAKGISPVPGSVTIHASVEYSVANMEKGVDEVGEELLAACAEWLPNIAPKMTQTHRWRYGRPSVLDGSPYLLTGISGPLVFAGDAFGGGNVMGAYTSGLAAADALVQVTNQQTKTSTMSAN